MARFDRAHRAITLATDALAALETALGRADVPDVRAKWQAAVESISELHEALHEAHQAIDASDSAALPTFNPEALDLKGLSNG